MAYGGEVDLDYHMMPYHSLKHDHQKKKTQKPLFILKMVVLMMIRENRNSLIE